MKKQVLIIIALFALLVGGSAAIAHATPRNDNAPKKYFVCKYVGKPGVDEKLQTGNNPISVPDTTLTKPVIVGSYFTDGQNRSYVVAEDTGQAEPKCPAGDEQPKACPVGTTLVDYENGDKQKPICKGEPTGCPYGDSIPVDSPKCVPPTGTTADDPNKGEVKSTTPTPVDDTVYPDFQGK